ncbi:phage tail family protein [Candidatus Babeliales bacterium]|nr:phage tail family protein [Candidatus Babeliales bacterium]
MFKLTFKNAEGETLEMGAVFPYILGKHSGLSSNDVITQTSKGYNQNGSYYYGSLDNARTINMTVYFNYASDVEGREKQKHIAKIFNPRLGMGQIVYEDSYGKYIIDGVVSLKPVIYRIDENEYSMTKAFDVVLTCPKPDWLSYEPKSLKMNTLIGGLTYPMSFPITFAETGTGGAIAYDGDNPADILFDFRVAEGGESMTNPKVANGKGEYIEIDRTIYAGEKILVDTNPDKPSIIFVDSDGNKSDAWENLIWGSTFFQLTRGENLFTFTASSGDPEVYGEYREHFAGV